MTISTDVESLRETLLRGLPSIVVQRLHLRFATLIGVALRTHEVVVSHFDAYALHPFIP